MKNLIAFILILTSISVYGQWQKHISGNGSFTTKSFDLSGFNTIGTSISGKITISKSNQFKVSLYCESNLMDYIEIFVKENSLKIQCKKGYSIDSKEIDLKIEMPDLEKLSSAGSADIVVNEGCILYKEGKYEEARTKFHDAMNATGYDCELAYNISLCHYKMKQLAPSLKYIAEII